MPARRDDTLDRNPHLTTLAGCLGDVVVATLASQSMAAGVRASSATDVVDVICVARDSRDEAEQLRRHASEELRTGRSTGENKPWSELLPAATVEVVGEDFSVVRIAAKPGADQFPGKLAHLMLVGGLSRLLGTQ